MIKLYKKVVLIAFLVVSATLSHAQYAASELETGKLNAALARDASGNIYTTRFQAAGKYEIVKYTNGTGSPSVIHQNINGDAYDLPYGLAIASNGDVYFSAEMSAGDGKIVRLNASSAYAATTVQTGRFFTGLAFDKSDRLYALEYVNSNFAVVRYDSPSSTTSTKTTLYGSIISGGNLSYPTSISVSNNLTVYFNNVFSTDGTGDNKGGIVTLSTADNGNTYSKVDLNTTNYTSALFIDEFNNLYAIESIAEAPYKLYKYANGAGSPAEFYSTTFSSAYPFLAYGVTAYDNKVYAIDGDNGSNGSRLLKLTPNDIVPPSVPTGLTAVSAGGSKISLSWNASSAGENVSGYRIYGGTTANPTTLIASIPFGTNTYTQTGLTAGQQYYYKISAIDIYFNESNKATDAVGTPIKPLITSAEYNAATKVLTVSGNNFISLAGANNDVNATKLTLRGENGTTRTLTTANVDNTNTTTFSLTLNSADQAVINPVLNKNGTVSTGGETYNLSVATAWAPGEDSNVDLAQATIPLTVSNVPLPTITSATYASSTGILVVTGTDLLKVSGVTNDIVANKFTLTGEGGRTYTLTNSLNAEIASSTSFTLVLSATDRLAVNEFINKNGTSSTGGTTYNIAAGEDWNAGADAAVLIADLTGNGIEVSGVGVPAISASTYDYDTGIFLVTGSNFLSRSGALNDIISNKFTFTGTGNATYTLTNTANVDIRSGTAFTIVLSSTDKIAVNNLINNPGTTSSDAVAYNLAAADDWNAGADASIAIADLTLNSVTVTNYNPVLPITLVNFDHQITNESVILNWTTSSELANKEFRILRSTDGLDFTELGIIKGAGNSNDLKRYAYTDDRPIVGMVYYKLVQFDLDGEMKLEKIIPVNFQLNGPSITFFPNPVKDILTLRTNGQAFDKATISDLSGKVVGIYKLTGAETSINMVNLSAGLYIIKLTGKAGQIVNRVMKN